MPATRSQGGGRSRPRCRDVTSFTERNEDFGAHSLPVEVALDAIGCRELRSVFVVHHAIEVVTRNEGGIDACGKCGGEG